MSELHGSPTFYKLLEEMSDKHSSKSHDYATNDDPYGNYHFAGRMSKLFDNPDDAGFMGRIAEKLYRLANLENGGKTPKNESVEDTEIDISVITALWMADRRDRRRKTDLKTFSERDKIHTFFGDISQPSFCRVCGLHISSHRIKE
jgi:hypothetical protein